MLPKEVSNSKCVTHNCSRKITVNLITSGNSSVIVLTWVHKFSHFCHYPIGFEEDIASQGT